MLKTIFVAGASRGLGFEICRLFHEKDWNIFGTATFQEGVDVLKRACPRAEGIICDIRNPKEIQKALDYAIEKFSKIDVLVNNVGIKGKGKIEEFSEDEIKNVTETNLLGTINATKKAAEIMKKQKQGRIINICSTFGIETSENFSIYCATKHGLRGFSRAAMKELAKENINVSIIYPGGMNTDFHDSPRPNFLNPKEVAEAVYFIATRPNDVLVSELVIVPKCEREYMI